MPADLQVRNQCRKKSLSYAHSRSGTIHKRNPRSLLHVLFDLECRIDSKELKSEKQYDEISHIYPLSISLKRILYQSGVEIFINEYE